MPDDASRIARYIALGSLAAASIFYVFGPSLFPDHDFKGTKKHGAVGLSNSANECFINSVLQALAASEKLRSHFKSLGGLEAEHASEIDKTLSNTDGDEAVLDGASSHPCGDLTVALALMLERLNDPALSGHTVSARPFIIALEVAYSSRLSRHQQDAQEFLQLIVEKLVEEHSSRMKAAGIEASDMDSRTLPLEGKLESHIECLTCHYRPPPRSSTFLTLSLNVPQRGVTSLDDCFDGLLRQEIIEDYICDKCKLVHLRNAKQMQLQRSNADDANFSAMEAELSDLERKCDANLEDFEDIGYPTTAHTPRRRIAKHMCIAHYPDVLLLHLSRSVYSSSSSKNTARVRFDENLRLGNFNRVSYRLASVVSHKGGHNSGHYETFRRQVLLEAESGEQSQTAEQHGRERSSESGSTKKKKHRQKTSWWGISDDYVRKCLQRDVLDMQRGCYILVYEKVEIASEEG